MSCRTAARLERREGEQQQERRSRTAPRRRTGSRQKLMPVARSWIVVAMKLTEPSSDEVIRKTIAERASQVWPEPAMSASGE